MEHFKVFSIINNQRLCSECLLITSLLFLGTLIKNRKYEDKTLEKSAGSIEKRVV